MYQKYKKTIGQTEFDNMVANHKTIDYCNIADVVIDGGKLENVNILNCYFVVVTVKNARLKNCWLTDNEFFLVEFKNCKIIDSGITSTSFMAVKFNHCAFVGAYIENINAITEVNFEKCIFHGTSFERSRLYCAYFMRNRLKGCSFTEADLTGVQFINTYIKDCTFNNASISKIGAIPLHLMEFPLDYGENVVYDATNDIVFLRNGVSEDLTFTLAEFSRYTDDLCKRRPDSPKYKKYHIGVQLFKLNIGDR